MLILHVFHTILRTIHCRYTEIHMFGHLWGIILSVETNEMFTVAQIPVQLIWHLITHMQNLFEIPASFWEVGYGVDCTGRPNGNYKSERTGHCDIFYICINGNSTLTHCSPGKLFGSKSSFCKNSSEACRPCGSVFNDC